MDKSLEELVEQVANLIKTEIKEGRIGRWEDMESMYIPEKLNSYFRGQAKQILSHPDLALIDRGAWPLTGKTPLSPIIPLAEALKEADNG